LAGKINNKVTRSSRKENRLPGEKAYFSGKGVALIWENVNDGTGGKGKWPTGKSKSGGEHLRSLVEEGTNSAESNSMHKDGDIPPPFIDGNFEGKCRPQG